MKYVNSIYRLLLLLGAVFCGQGIDAQTTGNQYHSTGVSKVEGVTAFSASSQSSGENEKKESAVDGNESTMWKSTTSSSSDRNPSIILDLGADYSIYSNYSKIQQIELFVKDVNRVASSVTVYSSNNTGSGWTNVASKDLDQQTNNIISLNKTLKGRYVRLNFTRRNSAQLGVSEVYFYASGSDLSQVSIKHKKAKWYDLRKFLNINAADNFDEDESQAMHQAYGGPTQIQAAHTLIDTLYVHRGTTVTLTLPDYLDEAANNRTYQRWYNYMTEGTFATDEMGVNVSGVVDLLTPGATASKHPTNGQGYRFANGYVGQPLSSQCLYTMDFYVPTEQEGGENWYLVACDVSGYTDYTAEFNTSTSKNSTFAPDYYEPTLSHRFVYYIRVIEDENSWAAQQLKAGKPIEEKDITMAATRLPDKTDEMVALSMDARSYLTPGGSLSEASGALHVELTNNTAGISLTDDSKSLSGEDRVIFFTYPHKNSDNTYSVDNTGSGDPKATIEVKRNGTLVARYNLTFKEDVRLLTQTQVSQENQKQDSPYEYRMPSYLQKNYELLTELNFDFDDEVAAKYGMVQCYPFPLGWNSSTYGFYDGGASAGDFSGPTSSLCPEWGYYGILNSYVECNDINGDSWGWSDYTYNTPNDNDPIRYNSQNNKSTYHLYADVSDRPGVIARLPFDRKLCPGTELFVTAWVKCARGDVSANNAAALFSIMGVKDRTVGTSSTKDYVPIFRYQTGQIPATYRNDGGLQGKVPGFAANNNDWMQVYFSFINTNSDDFESYVLQVDNNSASTNGGDIYIDDIRVYMMQPNAKVSQLEAGCTNDRVLMNAELNWDQLLSRLGLEEGDKEIEDGIDFCFIDETKYENHLKENPEDYKGAIEASVVEVGKNDGTEGSYNGKYHTLYFKVPFDANTAYNPENRPNLALNNTEAGKYYFYSKTDEAGVRSLSVDFYSALTPNRPYLMLINTHDDTDATLDASDFINVNDPCAIKTEFYVTSETLLRVNGEVINPSTDFCAGQIFNFSATMRVPTTINEDGTQAYTEIKDGVYFDWFFGSEEEYTQPNANYGNISLMDALITFRDNYPDNEDLNGVQVGVSQVNKETFTQEMYDLIQDYLSDEGETQGIHNRLVLHKDNLDITLLESGLQLVVQPIPTLKSPDGSISDELWAQVCWSYIPLVLNASGNAPQLHAGFNTVNYPAPDFNPGLRIGLKQIDNATASKPIKMNLRGAVLATLQNGQGYLGMITSVTPEVFSKIYLVGTDDPAYNNETFFPQDGFSEYSLPVGQILDLQAAPYEQGSSYEDYMKFYFDTETTQPENGFRFQPKEGYTYTLAVHFEEKSSDPSAESSNACFGSFTVDMKVVPEYVVWNGGTDGVHNWNNDSNWKRADLSDLKKASGDSYVSNVNNTTDNGFVPMLFTNVVMPKGSKAELYMAGYANGGAKWTMDNRPSYMQLPTENIQYDLMAYEGTSGITTERYRVNICNDIHFEPDAQMLHAEQLLYNKASMDVEVTPGVWTAMTTPLRDVVAGDWYTEKSGVQSTEYFKDITFGTGYDRLSPAVYQRSWNTAAKIVEAQPADNVPVSFATEWSAVYNDASVPYAPGNGFSLKAVPAAGTTAPLLFRFPKADTKYEVSTSSDDLTRANAGRLLISDMVDRSDPLKYKDPVGVDVELSSVADGTYLMVGNPFMAPLNVQNFLSQNESVLLQKYWYVDDTGTTHSVVYDPDANTWSEDTYWAKPYSVFLVQKADADATVTFTNTMQEWSQANDGTATGASLFTVKASDEQGSSKATLRYAADAENGFAAAEDAELIQSLDGNESAAPKVYTVAGNKAVGVNRIKNMRCVPLGVFAEENSTVTLTFQGVDQLKNATLYDAQTSTRTPLYENFSLVVDGPSHGRYFIESDGDATTGLAGVETDNAVNVSSVVPGQIVVTANAEIRTVKVWSADGTLLRTVAVQGNTCTLNGMERGMAIVEVTTSEPVVKKVLVK